MECHMAKSEEGTKGTVVGMIVNHMQVEYRCTHRHNVKDGGRVRDPVSELQREGAGVHTTWPIFSGFLGSFAIMTHSSFRVYVIPRNLCVVIEGKREEQWRQEERRANTVGLRLRRS